MALLNEINEMQSEGKTEAEIIESLKARGLSSREIREALTQTMAKEAVIDEGREGYETSAKTIESGTEVPIPGQVPQDFQERYPRPPLQELSNIEPLPQQEDYARSAQFQSTPMQYQQEQSYQNYQQQDYGQYAQGAISPDTITEIAEQAVTEKLSSLKEDIEKIIDLKTTFDAKVFTLDERLKRIEKIIDRLQLSIMQKVGDYIVNIEDIKKEIQETQKSFKAMSEKGHTSSTYPAHHEIHQVHHEHPAHETHHHK